LQQQQQQQSTNPFREMVKLEPLPIPADAPAITFQLDNKGTIDTREVFKNVKYINAGRQGC
jgi:hypothetical protein